MGAPSIALTGLGLITGAGEDVEKGWASITAGTSGIRTNTLFDTSELLTDWAGMVTSPQPDVLDRCYSLAATAIREALRSSGLDLDAVDRNRVAVVVGSSLGAMPTLEGVHAGLVHEGRLDAEQAAASQLPCVGDYIAAEFDLRGPRVVLSNACAASAVALGYAAELLWKEDVDYVICGGVDPLATLSAYGFSALGALDPEPCSPMSASTGLTLGEGAGFMVLEPADRAASRGARALAELGGYGLSCDGYHQTAPDPSGKGACAAMAQALETAGLGPADVDYLNLHGTGTPANDASEPKAVKLLFGADVPPASSTKSIVGHTLGAAGAVEAVVSTLAVDRGTLPPTINTRGVPSPFGLDIVPETGRRADPGVVLSNSFAFGGNNASVVIHEPGRAGGAPRRTEAVHDVVVTGMAGLAGAAGSTQALVEALAGERACFTGLEHVEGVGEVPVGRVDIRSAARGINPSRVRRMDPLSLLAAAAVADLYGRHGKPSRAEAEGTGVVFATGYGPVTSVLRFHKGVLQQGITGANPALFANTVVNAAAGHVAMLHRYRGYTATIANGGTSSVLALQLASRVIARGAAERIMVVIADEFPEQALATRAGLPGYARTPHVVPGARTGMVLSEGAAAILLESERSAASRGAPVLARVKGYGASGESVGIGRLGRDGEAWARSLRAAMAEAGTRPADIGTVVSAASGHTLVDVAERQAMKHAGLSGRPVLTPKALLGETYGSAGALGLVAALNGDARGHVLLSSFAHGGSYAAAVFDAGS
ncbi:MULTISPECIES: beta-ketoacyl-[acyl-carrier-protein] synthase family protein [unclassified Streptomyces]|uniref:beta-ketoacyl-[acyl-carrier-protein] synthase family protein n=1 Tax=unclassified Streptomyces TaxID=2593676 RepID=UPI0023D8F895|nr:MULTISPECIES: beta-ketoacyl-[acyl-carrier-protein] synthase family protein [unclassified Streptomyces]MCH0566837.1 beta-ketoacyl-[acyl-carrier-protein] synthase family protein [Streptomyces sp. MUM 2J]MCH0570231.1 beta-ketoacyl-[acyl-carrier-protein] synthase family protein [Streptomyces sp. MUM 136J]